MQINLLEEKITITNVDNRYVEEWYEESKAKKHIMKKRSLTNFDLLDLEKEDTVAEMGCGPGIFSVIVAKKVKEVYAFDYTQEYVNIGKRVAKQNNVKNIRFQKHDITMPLKLKNKFNKILNMETLEHVSDYKKAIKNMCSVLKRNGRIVISTPNKYGLAQIIKFIFIFKCRWPKGERYISPKLIKAELEKNGIKVTKQKYNIFMYNFLPNFLYPVNLILERIVENTPILNRICTTYYIAGDKK